MRCREPRIVMQTSTPIPSTPLIINVVVSFPRPPLDQFPNRYRLLVPYAVFNGPTPGVTLLQHPEIRASFEEKQARTTSFTAHETSVTLPYKLTYTEYYGTRTISFSIDTQQSSKENDEHDDKEYHDPQHFCHQHSIRL